MESATAARTIGGILLLALACATLAPPASSLGGVVGEPFCDLGTPCVPTSVCLDGLYCQATPCDPATDCRAGAHYTERCGRDPAIEGETCASRADADAAAGGRNVATPVGGAHAPKSSVAARADLTRGFVYRENLPNEWISHAVSVRVVLAGVDVGQTTVGVYQSSIDATGGDGEPHTFTHGSVAASHAGQLGLVGGSAGVTLLDGGLEACFVRLGHPGDAIATCEGLLPG